jgi:hypothetical protein
VKKIFIIILLWWMAVPYALGEGIEQNRCVVDSLREAIRLKDSLYSKASVETLAKYNAEFGNDQLQEENHFVSRSRTYIIILSIMLLAVAVVLVLHQRRYPTGLHHQHSHAEGAPPAGHHSRHADTRRSQRLRLR